LFTRNLPTHEDSVRLSTKVVDVAPLCLIILFTDALTRDLHACTYTCISTRGKRSEYLLQYSGQNHWSRYLIETL
jgi:hypothetical protein